MVCCLVCGVEYGISEELTSLSDMNEFIRWRGAPTDDRWPRSCADWPPPMATCKKPPAQCAQAASADGDQLFSIYRFRFTVALVTTFFKPCLTRNPGAGIAVSAVISKVSRVPDPAGVTV